MEKVKLFGQTNGCGDEYSHMDTHAISAKLGQAESKLDGMEIAVFFGVALQLFEALAYSLYGYCCGKKN